MSSLSRRLTTARGSAASSLRRLRAAPRARRHGLLSAGLQGCASWVAACMGTPTAGPRHPKQWGMALRTVPTVRSLAGVLVVRPSTASLDAMPVNTVTPSPLSPRWARSASACRQPCGTVFPATLPARRGGQSKKHSPSSSINPKISRSAREQKIAPKSATDDSKRYEDGAGRHGG